MEEKNWQKGKGETGQAACQFEPLWHFFYLSLFAGLIPIAIYKISLLSSLFPLLFSLQTLLRKVLVWSQFFTVSSRKRQSLSSVILFTQFIVLVQVVFRSSQNTNELDFKKKSPQVNLIQVPFEGLYMYSTHMAHLEKFKSRQFALVWSLGFFC